MASRSFLLLVACHAARVQWHCGAGCTTGLGAGDTRWAWRAQGGLGASDPEARAEFKKNRNDSSACSTGAGPAGRVKVQDHVLWTSRYDKRIGSLGCQSNIKSSPRALGLRKGLVLRVRTALVALRLLQRGPHARRRGPLRRVGLPRRADQPPHLRGAEGRAAQV